MTEDVDEFLARVTAPLAAEIPAMAEQVVATALAATPAHSESPGLRELRVKGMADSITTGFDLYALGGGPSAAAQARAPRSTILLARRLAQHEYSVSVLWHQIRVTQGFVQQRLLEAVAEATTDPNLISAAVHRLSDMTFQFVDTVSAQLVDAYNDERASWKLRQNGGIGYTLSDVMPVLTGQQTDLTDAEDRLDYQLDQVHVGLIVSTDDALPNDRLELLHRVVATIASQADCASAPLMVAPDDSTVWSWLPEPDLAAVAACARAAAVKASVWIAVGTPGSGVQGFRRTHRTALDAQQVSLAAAPDHRSRVTSAGDIGVIGMLVGNMDTLRDRVHETLGPLADDTPSQERMRETLRAFFNSGGNYLTAGEALGLHKNTVRYRVQKAEELTDLRSRKPRLEVELALLACHVLGSTVLRPLPGTKRVS